MRQASISVSSVPREQRFLGLECDSRRGQEPVAGTFQLVKTFVVSDSDPGVSLVYLGLAE